MNRYYILLLGLFLSTASFSQSINTEFGKNRVQYHDDFNNYTRYETENFVTYWYGKSRNIAQATIQMAELYHGEIQALLEHTLSDKIEVIVYIDLNDLKQSNIGLEEAFTNTAGKTKIVGTKMFVYFDGNHLNLRQQIRQGITSVYLNSILFGSSLQEIVQNALLLNLPSWFGEGLVAFGTSTWDYEIDDELRDLLEHNKKYKDFDKLAKDHPRVAGHSMWHFVATVYGNNTIANLIYLTRINRKLENSFLFILGEDFDDIKLDWYTFYNTNYNSEQKKFEETSGLTQLNLKNKKGIPVSHMRQSPNGEYLAYVINDRGKEKVFVRNLATGEEKRIFKNGHKNIFQAPDYNYPLITWHPRRNELTILYERRDITKLRRINVKSEEYEEQLLTENFQRVYSIDYRTDDDYILTAAEDGFSDIFLYRSNNRNHRRLTEDFYDDLDGQVIRYNGADAVLFRSNRTSLDLEKKNRIDTILPLKEFDLYLLKGLGDNKELVQLTNTPDISEKMPVYLGNGQVLYTVEKSGVLNSYVLDMDTGETFAVSNLSRNIILQHASPGSENYYLSFYDDGSYKVFEKPLSSLTNPPHVTALGRSQFYANQPTPIPFLPQEEEKEKPEQKISEGMKFQTPFDDPPNLEPIIDQGESQQSEELFNKYFKDYYSESTQDGKRIIKYNPMRATASRLKFRLADFTTKMDNNVLFEGLESYTGNDKELNNIPVGILFKGTIKDLFEDYQIEVGLRIPTNFSGYEYFATFDNNKYLWDKRIAFYRRSESVITNPAIFPVQREKRHTFLGLYRLKYPFDIYRSIRFTGSLRFDKYFQVVTDPTTFNAPAVNEKRLSLRAEYVFDNSFDVAVNIKNGTRYKFFAEVINQFNFELTDGINIDPSEGITGVVGVDARHYIPLFKFGVLAMRASAASSFGSNRIVYFLGGMENWIFSKFDQSIPLPPGESFSYKVLAPHLRGFDNNVRNGNTYALTNVELRLPVFRFLGFDHNHISFLRNLQLTTFFDAGLAWYGLGPDSEDNPLNTVTIESPPDNPVVSIEARYFRDPLVMGYGFGIRSTLLGYFLKFDYAWGIDTGTRQEPRLYFSLGMDF